MTQWTRIPAQAAILTAVFAFAAGCGGSGSDPGSSGHGATPHTDQVATLREAAKCLRSHGYPSFPDPVQNENGEWVWGPGTPGKTRPTVCDDLIKRAKSLSRPKDAQRVSSADLAKLQAYAACMRHHGLADWPDPATAGDFKLPASLEQKRSTAQYRAANSACEPQLGGTDVRIQH
jgi:hypothetical protein